MDIALHWVLDMAGAVTFACIARGCQDTRHKHNRVVKVLVRNRWVTQSISALIVAVVTVKIIG